MSFHPKGFGGMPMFDLPLEELKTYCPPRDEPADFDAFWEQTLAETHEYALDTRFDPFHAGLQLVDTFDVTFSGFGGQRIKGWLILPRQRTEPLPCVVEYIGYGGGRGHPLEWLTWSAAGYAHFVMDTRGQGSAWSAGDTPDIDPDGSSPQIPGFLTRGIQNPRTFYYRRLYTDAVRAIEAARAHPEVDGKRIALSGGSQGGGVALAAAGLVPDVSCVLPDVPFLSHFRVVMEITEAEPYNEVIRYCRTHRDMVERVFGTLAYFDGINFAARANMPALFSVGLMDEVCPPRSVFAAYNHYSGEKRINVYPYNHHEGGGIHQTVEKLRFLSHLWQ
jgi:cephalosporin-C deacetylase